METVRKREKLGVFPPFFIYLFFRNSHILYFDNLAFKAESVPKKTLMKQIIFLVSLFLLQMDATAGFPSHSLTICGTTFTVTATVENKKNIQIYQLTIEQSGTLYRKMTIGKLINDASRTIILKALKDSLHKADLFAPCRGNADMIDQNIDNLINALIREVFPYSHINTVDEKIINDNNKLKLLKEVADNTYQLSNITPTNTMGLVIYNAGSFSYEIIWANLITSQLILENFDKLLSLYYEIPSTAVKPILYLNGNNEIIYSYDGHTGIPTTVILPAEISKKLAGKSVNTVAVGGVNTILYIVKNPNDPETSKKSNDDPLYKEVRQ